MSAPRRTGVLFLPDFRSGNPYQARLAECLREHGFEVVFAAGDARRALLRRAVRRGGFDVVHVHWPENYAAAPSRLGLVLRGGLFLLLLRLVALRGVRVVWTVHNLDFHELRHPAFEERFRRRLARACQGLAVHYPAAEALVRRRLGVPEATPVAVTPLGGDAPPADALAPPRRAGAPYVFCHLGEIRRYKHVERIVAAFRGLPRDDVRLVVAGRVRDADLERELVAAASGDPRIELDFAFLDAAALDRRLREADAFVLGGDEYFTTASALQAAGWGLVVVAPRHPHLESFLDPGGWVRYRAGDVDDLRRALAEAGAASGGGNRERAVALTYPRLAAATAALYRAVGARSPG